MQETLIFWATFAKVGLQRPWPKDRSDHPQTWTITPLALTKTSHVVPGNFVGIPKYIANLPPKFSTTIVQWFNLCWVSVQFQRISWLHDVKWFLFTSRLPNSKFYFNPKEFHALLLKDNSCSHANRPIPSLWFLFTCRWSNSKSTTNCWHRLQVILTTQQTLELEVRLMSWKSSPLPEG